MSRLVGNAVEVQSHWNSWQKESKPLIRSTGWILQRNVGQKINPNRASLWASVQACLGGGSGWRFGEPQEWKMEMVHLHLPFLQRLWLFCGGTQDPFTLRQRRLQATSSMPGPSRLASQSLSVKPYIVLYKPLARMYFCDMCGFQSSVQEQLCPKACSAGDKNTLNDLTAVATSHVWLWST